MLFEQLSIAAPYFSKIDMIGGFRKCQSPPFHISFHKSFQKSGDRKLSLTNPRDLCNKIFYRFYFYSVSQIDVDLSLKFGRYMMRTTSRFEAPDRARRFWRTPLCVCCDVAMRHAKLQGAGLLWATSCSWQRRLCELQDGTWP
jgi:hypothetical protein